ncbi:MAG: hypothetical protein ACK4SL_01635 [Candidatus Paceibacteria bacterium]
MNRFILFLLFLVAGPALAEIEVSPSYVERQLRPGSDRLMCTSVDLAIESAQVGEKLQGCGWYMILAPRVRSYMKLHGKTYTILEIGPPWNERYWLEPKVIKDRKRRLKSKQ